MTPQTATTDFTTTRTMAMSTPIATTLGPCYRQLLPRVVADTMGLRSPTARRRHYLAGFVLLILFLILTPSTVAQTGGPSPTPSPFTPPSEAGLPSAQIQKLMDLVRELVPY